MCSCITNACSAISLTRLMACFVCNFLGQERAGVYLISWGERLLPIQLAPESHGRVVKESP